MQSFLPDPIELALAVEAIDVMDRSAVLAKSRDVGADNKARKASEFMRDQVESTFAGLVNYK